MVKRERGMLRSPRNTLWACFLCVFCGVGLLIATFNPGSGPGNINATSDLALVTSCYTFTDGNYARGFIDFTQGFTVSPNSKVTLSLQLPVVINDTARVGFDVTSTIILEDALKFNGVVPLQGSFQASMWTGGVVTIFADSFTILNNVFFPSWLFFGSYQPTFVNLYTYLYTQGGQIYKNERAPFGAGLLLGDDKREGGLTIYNSELILSDAPTSTWPVFRYDGAPFIRSLYPVTKSSQLSRFTCVDSSLNIVEQASFLDIWVTFDGNCAVKNSSPFDPLPSLYNKRPLVTAYPGGAQKARFIIDSTINGLKRYIVLQTPCSLTLGPNVAMRIGNLGYREFLPPLPIVRPNPLILPFGGIMGSFDSSEMSFDASVTLIDSSITFSLPCTIEGGVGLTVQGDCDLYSVSATTTNRVFTVGRYAQGQAGSFPMDSNLDIKSGSALNLHNMILCNDNNP
jgi:hypothetical protein